MKFVEERPDEPITGPDMFTAVCGVAWEEEFAHYISFD